MTLLSKISTAALAVVLLAALSATAADAAEPRPNQGSTTAVAGCVGSAFSGTLEPGKAICNGNYLVRMQPNGDLVLRVISTGRACWASGTRAAGDASATFNMSYLVAPDVTINSVSQGELAKIYGGHAFPDYGTNASVNQYGEFWIGYKRIGWC